MKREYVKAMDDIKADDELKRTIIRQAGADSGQVRISGKRFRSKGAMIGVSFAIILLSAILGPAAFRDKPQADSLAAFRGFAVTAYAANGAALEVRPEAEFPLGRYSPFMSRVPGFPVGISAAGADRIEVRASAGGLLLWDRTTSAVSDLGNRAALKPGETFYWSPLGEEPSSAAAASATLEIDAYRQGEKIGSGEIDIRSEDGGEYKAKLVDGRSE